MYRRTKGLWFLPLVDFGEVEANIYGYQNALQLQITDQDSLTWPKWSYSINKV